MKSGQLIECSMRKNFLRKYIAYVMEKLAPDPFIKNAN